MPDEGKNKQTKPTKPTKPTQPPRPEPGSPEARRQTMMWWLWLAIGLLAGATVRFLLGRIGR